MTLTETNPILDHLFARMIFNLAQVVPAGNCLLVEVSELGCAEFCAEQLLAIAKDEGEQEKKPIRAYIASQVLKQHPLGSFLVQDSFRKKVSENRLNPNVLVVILHRVPTQHLLHVVDHYIKLSSDGYIEIPKNRSGDTTVEPIPWEYFRDRRFYVNDLLGRRV